MLGLGLLVFSFCLIFFNLFAKVCNEAVKVCNDGILFGGNLSKKGTCSSIKSSSDGEKNMSDFLL